MPVDKESRIKQLVEDVARISADFASFLVPLNGDYETNTVFIDWMSQADYHGAFKLNLPKQDRYLQRLYSDFLNAGSVGDTYVYLAGDDVSFMGGWSEDAIETAINAVGAAAVSLGWSLRSSPAIALTARREISTVYWLTDVPAHSSPRAALTSSHGT